MAEKTDTKKIESSKESYKAPVAEIAEKIRKEGEKVTEENLQEKIKQELEKSQGKKDFEDVKKTVEAHGTLSEKESEEKAEKSEEVSKEMIEKSVDKESKEEKAEEKVEEPVKQKKDYRDMTKEERIKAKEQEKLLGWEPKTKLGEEVKNSKIKSIDEILDNNRKILEEEIIDTLIDVKSDLISVGQSKGKFGGGKRRAWRQTQKKTKEGNVPTFSTMAVIGDEKGHVGIGEGKASETLPARDKAIRKAKLNLIKVKRTCSAFDCLCSEPHTIPFEITGKSGSVKVKLIPAPQGTGLVVGKELKKILGLAGIKDIYSQTFGKKRTTFNLIKACFDALQKTTSREK